MRSCTILIALAAYSTHCTSGSGSTQRSTSVPPRAASNVAQDLLVVSAVYGSGTSFADVTCRVDDLLHQPSVEFFARPEWLHADPTPGWNKALVIVFELKGTRYLFCTGEGGRVSVDTLVQGTDGERRQQRNP